jgi:hypothetical protein
MRKRSVLTLAFCAPIFAQAGQDQKKPAQESVQIKDKVTVSVAPVVPAPDDSGAKQGIKVHGYWKIDVVNPDGTVASHREFENALTPSGAYFLSQVATGALNMTPVNEGGGLTVVLPLSGTPPDYFIYPPSVGIPGGSVIDLNGNIVYANVPSSSTCPGSPVCALTLGVNTSPTGIVFTGNTLPMAQAGQITGVATVAYLCNGVLTAAQCLANNVLNTVNTVGKITLPFTAATLATPISFAEGQIVQVTVTISFS